MSLKRRLSKLVDLQRDMGCVAAGATCEQREGGALGRPSRCSQAAAAREAALRPAGCSLAAPPFPGAGWRRSPRQGHHPTSSHSSSRPGCSIGQQAVGSGPAAARSNAYPTSSNAAVASASSRGGTSSAQAPGWQRKRWNSSSGRPTRGLPRHQIIRPCFCPWRPAYRACGLACHSAGCCCSCGLWPPPAHGSGAGRNAICFHTSAPCCSSTQDGSASSSRRSLAPHSCTGRQCDRQRTAAW